MTQAEYDHIKNHLLQGQQIGDIIYASATDQLRRLGIGSANDVLKVTGGIPAWSAVLAGLTLTAPAINGTVTTTGLTLPAFTAGGNITATSGLTIGLGASAPAPDQSGLHIWKATAGAITGSVNAHLFIENSGVTGIDILTVDDTAKVIYFSQPTGGPVGQIVYDGAVGDGLTFQTGVGGYQFSAGPFNLQDGYISLTERAAPGAGAANTARIYAVVGGDTLTDLAAVFQDGTVDIFAQEVTPLDSPIFRYPSGTVGTLRMTKPHPGLQIFEMVFPDGTSFILRQFEHHDRAKIQADTGSAGPLPNGWDVKDAADRAAYAEATRQRPTQSWLDLQARGG